MANIGVTNSMSLSLCDNGKLNFNKDPLRDNFDAIT